MQRKCLSPYIYNIFASIILRWKTMSSFPTFQMMILSTESFNNLLKLTQLISSRIRDQIPNFVAPNSSSFRLTLLFMLVVRADLKKGLQFFFNQRHFFLDWFREICSYQSEMIPYETYFRAFINSLKHGLF